MSSIHEAIANARKEAQELHEQIKNTRKKTNDCSIRDMDVKEVPPLKLKERRVLRGHTAKIYSLAWARDSTHLLSASQDGKLIIWDTIKNFKVHAIPLRSHWVMCCDYSPSGNAVAAGGLDNICSIYTISSLNQAQNVSNDVKPHRELSGHSGYLSCCKFLNDRHILSSSGDSSCILWDTEMGHPISRFEEHTGDCMSISILPSGDNNIFVSGACDGNSKLWDIRMNKCVATFTGHEGDINSVQFFPSGNAFATGSDDCTCRLFDLRASREVMTYSDDNVREGVTSISFSKSGRVLFAAYEYKKVIAWDTLKGKPLQILDGLPNGHDSRVSSLSVSPDGQSLATCSWDYTLKIFA